GRFLFGGAGDPAGARGANPVARLAAALNARSSREPGAVTAALARLWATLPAVHPDCAVISGASGASSATAEERVFLDAHADFAVRATGTRIGHGVEPQFAMNIALGAMAVERRAPFPPCHPSEGGGAGAPTPGVGNRARPSPAQGPAVPGVV